MDILYETINKQFKSTALKNIFSTKTNPLSFTESTKKSLTHFKHSHRALSNEENQQLIQHLISGFLNSQYNSNPYISFSTKDHHIIQNIYETLLTEIKVNEGTWDRLEEKHYNRIRNFINLSNPSIFHLNNTTSHFTPYFVCSEYTAEFQMALLALNSQNCVSPILDIGCGKHGYLIEALLQKNYKAFGIDRLAKNDPHYESCNWLEYNYGHKKWSTIISNLSFTSHFIYHHQRNTELCSSYAKTYMAILDALKQKGQWIYGPSVPFIEDCLPEERFLVTRHPLPNNFFKTTITKR